MSNLHRLSTVICRCHETGIILVLFFCRHDQKKPAATGRFGLSEVSKPGESFLSFAFLNMLLDIVLRSRDPRIIIEGLKVISQPNFPSTLDQVESFFHSDFESFLHFLDVLKINFSSFSDKWL